MYATASTIIRILLSLIILRINVELILSFARLFFAIYLLSFSFLLSKQVMESNCNTDSCASTNQQPYRKKLCNICGIYVSSNNISRHLKSHASQLQCEQCGASFNRHDSLWRHKNHFHKTLFNTITNDTQHTTSLENQ